ncbi:MAG: acyl-CoA synthetase FdrA [Acidobacteriota bacterium]
MSVLLSERRPGAYYDSIILMRLQSALAKLPEVLDAGVVMATSANLALLESNGLLPEGAAAVPDDLLVVVKAADRTSAQAALGEIDALLERRRAAVIDDYRPRSLDTACQMLPDASWVLVSVPGRYAAEVADRALDAGKHVFLYSDNVSLAEEVRLKRRAADHGLLVMGPDCGTAIVAGVCLGFANRVRRGAIGLVGASGTGLQAVTCRIHELGGGVSHAFGTGGRDLSSDVAAGTTLQALDVLGRDAESRVVVLVSKPPSPRVASQVLAAAQRLGKPVVVDFLGYPPPGRRLGNVRFATSLEEAAALAVELEQGVAAEVSGSHEEARSGWVRGLFAGGTLAYEALLGFRTFLQPLYSNISVGNVAADSIRELEDPNRSEGHTVLDLGEDEFTVGRLHPMMDQDLRIRRLRQEAEDPEVALIVLDIVLGFGSHADPASELAPVIAEIRQRRDLPVVVLVLGTDEDPQDVESQVEQLEAAGAIVTRQTSQMVAAVHQRIASEPGGGDGPAVARDGLAAPIAAINVGLEIFHDGLQAQEASSVHVDWRPPAGGNERLAAILRRMRPNSPSNA